MPKPIQNQVTNFELIEMVKWWEKKRLIYNAILLPITAIIIWSMWEYVGPTCTQEEAIANAIWIIFGANICYTGGWVGGVLKYYYFGSYSLSLTSRWVLFSLGTLFSISVIDLYFTFLFDVIFAY
jgi:hypothetical protein